ncbi:hypothetical protein ACHAPT_006937 [Fusarium lateritium]
MAGQIAKDKAEAEAGAKPRAEAKAMTKAELDAILMPPPKRPATRKTPAKRATKPKDATPAAPKKPRARKNEKTKDQAKGEKELPEIEPLNRDELLLFPIYNSLSRAPTMTLEGARLWSELAPQAGESLMTNEEVAKLCDEFYK